MSVHDLEENERYPNSAGVAKPAKAEAWLWAALGVNCGPVDFDIPATHDERDLA